MTERRIALVRHGVTDWNREGRFQGHLDPPLSEIGRQEARLVADRLAADDDLRPARIISSTLGRALQTADAIAEQSGVGVEQDARLIEIGQGEWEGRTHSELAETDGERYRAWRAAAGIRRPPGGETIESALERIASLIAELDASPSSAAWPVCLVSHGGILRVVAGVVLDLALDASWALDVDNASLSVVRHYDAGWRLERWNDTLHLLGRQPTHVDEAEGRPLAL